MNLSSLKRIIAIILFLIANRVSGQYSGTYTVGGSSPNFNTLTAAFNALKASGISGNVRLNVRSGTYTERISIGGISGASNSAIIKVAPDPNNTSPVIIKNSLTSLSTNFIFEANSGTTISDTLDAGSGFKIYKWNTSAATQKIVVNDEGTYFVKVTDTNGCEGTDTILIKFKKTERVNYTSKTFKVFPNPAESMLNIVSNSAIIETIKVYDLEGRIVLEKFDKSNESQIDITSLLNGMYFAVISTNKGSEAMKFVVKH